VAFLVEVVVDKGMYGGEFLERFRTPEPGHRSLSPPEGLVRVFCPVVQPTPGFLAISNSNQLHRCRV